MKQETLEEAMEKYPLINQRIGFKLGAKWQQERSYNEEDMKDAYEQGARLALISQSSLALHKGKFPTPDEWFDNLKQIRYETDSSRFKNK